MSGPPKPVLGLAFGQTRGRAGGEDGLQGLTRGVAFRLVENFGATSRVQFGDDLRQLNQEERSKLRQLGVRFGEYTVFMPALLKPAPAAMLTMLWALWTERRPSECAPPKAGLVSTRLVENLPHAYYYASGYRPSGARAVRIDMLERLAGDIRGARKGADMRQGFEATAHMMSFVGCSGEEFESILHSLGFRKHVEKRAVPAVSPASDAPAEPPASEAPTGTIADANEPSSIAPANENINRQEAAGAALDSPVSPEGPERIEAAAPSDALPESPEASSETAPPADEPAPAAAADQSPQDAAADQADDPQADAPAASVETGDGAALQEIEVTIWRPAPRRHPGSKSRPGQKPGAKPDRKPAGARNGAKAGAKPPRHDRGAKPEGRKFNPKPQVSHGQPRHRKTADPNSPFAVLAGLKDELSKAQSAAPQNPSKPTEKVK